jgi:hypothetical protein
LQMEFSGTRSPGVRSVNSTSGRRRAGEPEQEEDNGGQFV